MAKLKNAPVMLVIMDGWGNGDLTAKDGEAIHIETFEDGSLSVEVGGDVNAGKQAENGESYTGIYAGSYGDGTNDISIGGDVTAALWTCLGYTVLLCFTLFKSSSVAKSIFNAH